MADKLKKSDAEWRAALGAQEFQVTRCSATEPAFTGRYWDCKEDGTYACICCGEPLFRSEDKFDSGTGWPSFTRPLEEGSIEEHEDRAYGMVRTEVRCSKCDAHLGHVFPDGPRPTGMRYCINSASLDLKKK